MKIVLDTNVVVSGLLNSNGKPAQILNLLLNQKIKLLFDNRILQEYSDVLYREKFQFTEEMVEPLLEFMKMEGEFILANPINDKFSDEDDKKFLEIAISGNANYLITGNTNHFPKKDIIISPSEFIEEILK